VLEFREGHIPFRGPCDSGLNPANCLLKRKALFRSAAIVDTRTKCLDLSSEGVASKLICFMTFFLLTGACRRNGVSDYPIIIRRGYSRSKASKLGWIAIVCACVRIARSFQSGMGLSCLSLVAQGKRGRMVLVLISTWAALDQACMTPPSIGLATRLTSVVPSPTSRSAGFECLR
jgi:hypothetical protein